MNNYIIKEHLNNINMTIFLPTDYYETTINYPILYINDGELFNSLYNSLLLQSLCDFVIVSLESKNTLSDYSPWYHKAYFKQVPDFGGNGNNYLEQLINNIIPYICKQYKVDASISKTAIAGYSIAGLISLYSAYKYTNFSKILCLSGSLWYPDFIEFMRNNSILNKEIQIYLSIGKNEGKYNKQFPFLTLDYTNQAYDIIKGQLGADHITYELNPGNHFEEIDLKFQKAFTWLKTLDFN